MSIKNFSVPRGTSDILPEQIPTWQMIESKAREIFHTFGFREIRTPYFEETELFARSMGQTSDVVQKQMLNLQAQLLQGDEEKSVHLSLRPENTASVVRSYIQNRLDKKEGLSKLYYLGAMFRGERPQKGRLRQFHQMGVEAIGPDGKTAYLDAEVISLAVYLLKSFGLNNFKLKINTLGDSQDKENFSKYLRTELKPRLSQLCPDCQSRFERNVFRILDCKNHDCQKQVSQINLDDSYLSSASREYFQQVKKVLNDFKIEYEVTPKLVRGLDYYTHTVFEITGSSLGSQDALGAGGRYNRLVEDLSGPDVPAVGFALGIERIILALGEKAVVEEKGLDAFIVALDQPALSEGVLILNELRLHKISSDIDYTLASMKSQMRLANKLKAAKVIIIGENELKKEVVLLKNMSESTQEEISIKNKNYSTLLNRIAK